MRLAHYLAVWGVASRRAAERLVTRGLVQVDGEVVRDPARDVDSDRRITIDGAPLESGIPRPYSYLMFHKPVGVVSTMKPGGDKSPCLADVIDFPRRIFPVGRLDRDSSGLLLLTDDGELTNLLTHPSHGVEKEYLVRLASPLSAANFRKITRGVTIEERRVAVKSVQMLRPDRLSLVIHEGRNRIVRRMFGAVGCKVVDLKRVRMGSVRLGKLTQGKWRLLKPVEVKALLDSVQSSARQPAHKVRGTKTR